MQQRHPFSAVGAGVEKRGGVTFWGLVFQFVAVCVPKWNGLNNPHYEAMDYVKIWLTFVNGGGVVCVVV